MLKVFQVVPEKFLNIIVKSNFLLCSGKKILNRIRDNHPKQGFHLMFIYVK